MKYFTVLLVLTITLSATPSYAQQKITFAYQDSDNFPYQIGDNTEIDAQSPGVAVEMMRYLSVKLNLNLQFIRLPWTRGLFTLQSGEIDGLFNASYKESRLRFGAFPITGGALDRTKRSYTNTYSIFKSRTSKISWNGDSFDQSHYSLFAPRGFSIIDDLKRNGLTVIETSNILQALNTVNQGRLDGIALFTPAGEAYLRKFPKNFPNIENITPPLATKDYYLMLSHLFVKQQPELAKAIWACIEEYRESSMFRKLIEEYYNKK